MTDADIRPDLPGYRVNAVETWIGNNVPALKPPFEWTQLKGGHSNLTYRLTDRTGRQAVIRRPPEGKLLPKAHDMGREWALISALAPTDVPVPEPLGFCETSEVTGASFYLMGWVNGAALHSRADVEAQIPVEARRTVAFSLISVLASLHSLDPDAIGLGQLGRKDGYISRQIRAWYGSWTGSVDAARHDDPRAHDIKAYLEAHVPDQGAARVVHGDCALHNVLIGSDHKVTAVLDWEVATLGDPLADIAYTLNSFPDAADRQANAYPQDATTAADGFPARAELADHYAGLTGADLGLLDYYLAFNNWKTAAIIHGVRARYMAGQKSAKGVDLDGLKARVERALAAADAAIGRLKC